MQNKVRNLTGLAVLTAIVIVLQFVSMNLRFSMFSITLVLVPVVVGAALYGPMAGGWLGLVFGFAVLMTGDAAAFLAVNIPGTILTVLLKGVLAGLCAGLVYRLLERRSPRGAVFCAAVTSPVVNTGVFLLCCLVFFMPTINDWAAGLGFPSAGNYMIFGLVGVNFLIELAVNIILAPVAVRLINIGRQNRAN